MEQLQKKKVIYLVCIYVVLVISGYGHQCYGHDTSKNNNGDGHVEDSDADYLEEFIPTKEWQVVKPGQAIPAGLHVRLNMENGGKEAKLMEEDTNKIKKTDVSILPDETEDGGISEDRRMLRMKKTMEDALKDLNKDSQDVEEPVYWKDGDKAGMMNMFKDHFTHEEIKDALKKYKAEEDDVQDEELRKEAIKKKFRSMDELKQDMEDMNLNVKTDLEILSGLCSDYQEEEEGLDTSHRIRILTDLEYYAHQIDNAVSMVDLGCMELVLKDLNHTNAEVKSTASSVIGSAAQSNPHVQVHLLEAGAMAQLLRLFSAEKDADVQSRVMYALSSLLRHFPLAQMKFIQQGGLQPMRDALLLGRSDKVKVKIVTLLGDLIQEQNSLVEHPHFTSRDKVMREKIRQYKMVPLLESLLDHGWCDIIPSMLYLRDHDHREKVLHTMEQLLDMNICQAEISTYDSALSDLFREYERLVRDELSQAMEPGEESYFVKFIEIILNIKRTIQTSASNEGLNRDEL